MLRRWIFCTGTVSCSPEIMATCSFIYNRVCLYSVQCSATVWWHTLYNTLKLYLTRYSNSQLSISFHFECKILVAACVLIRLLVTVAIKCFQLGGCHCYQLTTVIALPQRGIVRKIDKTVWKYANVCYTCHLRNSFQQKWGNSDGDCGFSRGNLRRDGKLFCLPNVTELTLDFECIILLKIFLQMQW